MSEEAIIHCPLYHVADIIPCDPAIIALLERNLALQPPSNPLFTRDVALIRSVYRTAPSKTPVQSVE